MSKCSTCSTFSQVYIIYKNYKGYKRNMGFFIFSLIIDLNKSVTSATNRLSSANKLL